MRTILLAAAAISLAVGPALAETTKTHAAHRHATPAKAPASGGAERPIDNGPNTPEANRAYQGGGVVLEGQPGGPAPVPQATPAGQTPRNAVPR